MGDSVLEIIIVMKIWIYARSPVVNNINRGKSVGSIPSVTQKAQPEQSMHWTNITTTVGESTHIVNRIKSLTVPCGSRLMLIFFSSGRCFSCCLLGAGTACSPETVGFPTGCSYFDRLGWPGLRNVKLFGFRPGCSLSTVSVELDCETRSCSASLLAAVSWTVNTIWGRYLSAIRFTQRKIISGSETATDYLPHWSKCDSPLRWRSLHDCVYMNSHDCSLCRSIVCSSCVSRCELCTRGHAWRYVSCT